ncbi:MAG: hypothetical protein WA081_17565 [Desulfosalsimonadaceae bacterium]
MANQVINQQSPVSIDDWHRLIAFKSKASIEDVKKTLDKHGIVPQSTTPIRKAIRFHELQFSGIKVGTKNDGDFSFNWDGLDTGLYGVLSEDNLVGKSSILRLLYSILRGDFSGVSEPVLEWINHLKARLSIGDTELELALIREEAGFNATLTRSKGIAKSIDYSGHVSELSAIVDQLFMKELEFERMFATMEAKSLVPHGWPAMASALFVSGVSGAVVGDLTISGLPQRLLQCFIGLPWISTQSRASAIYKIEEESLNAKKRKKKEPNGVADALERLQAELESLPNTKHIEEKRKKNRIRQSMIEREIDESSHERTRIKVEAERIGADVFVIETERIKLRQLSQSLEDDIKAGYVFRKLQPVCCPSCESTNFKGGNSKSTDDRCPLCKEERPIVEAVEDVRVTELKKEISALEEQLFTLKESYKIQQGKLQSIEATTSILLNELEEIKPQKTPDRSIEEIATRRISLESTIAELKSIEQIDDTDHETPINELAILKAAVSETKKMYQEKEVQLFEDASMLLRKTATDLGVKHLAGVTWTSTSLKIKVANTETTYIKLSPGEKLRFRIAASVTIAKLAARTGQGRHPGVLFFDSPKAEEITEADFQEIMLAITEMANEDNDLQIFVASRVPADFTGLDLFKDSKLAVGKNFIF